MATVYRFEVECVSAFCAYSEEDIAKLIEKALKDFEDEITGLRLESISVKKLNKRITKKAFWAGYIKGIQKV
jgi:hypothetical protein